MATPIILTGALLVLAAVSTELPQDRSPDAPPTEAASAAQEPLAALPSYREPSAAWKTVDEAAANQAICRDRIHEAREQMGQPPLRRGPVTGEEPVLIWAVDRREDGCAVLVAKGDPDDIRPIPQVEKHYGLRPAQ